MHECEGILFGQTMFLLCPYVLLTSIAKPNLLAFGRSETMVYGDDGRTSTGVKVAVLLS